MSAFVRATLRKRLRHTEPVKTLFTVSLDDIEHELYVIGDPGSAAYEWVIRRDDQWEHSDAGYGTPAIALRDGLIAYYGLPDSVKSPAP